jgi:hypothetical protein
VKNDGSNVEKYSAFSVIEDEEGGRMLLWNFGPCPADSNILLGKFWYSDKLEVILDKQRKKISLCTFTEHHK